jgi:hypothetical protein
MDCEHVVKNAKGMVGTVVRRWWRDGVEMVRVRHSEGQHGTWALEVEAEASQYTPVVRNQRKGAVDVF